ncbi:hypothetical protein BY996DRAFT_4583001 [Phakopsora pachyrhizi]|nr:hypothetical protein BY996DRAFT_4583001 [Phakopsora pachyrhizi]
MIDSSSKAIKHQQSHSTDPENRDGRRYLINDYDDRNPLNPIGIQPLGNQLISGVKSSRSRSIGLGRLSILTDEIILMIFSELDVRDLYRSQAVSKTFFAWSTSLEGLWKAEFITKNDGKLSDWKGSWRRSFIHKFILRKKLSNDNECTESEEDKGREELPTDGIRIDGIYSDVLFQPILCSTFSIQRLYNSGKRSRSGRSTQIERISGCDVNHYRDLRRTPTVLTNLMDSWKCYRPRSDDISAKDSTRTKAWTFESLIERYPELNFRAEASLTNLIDYRAYHDHCERDESPVYLFDHRFVESSSEYDGGRGLGGDFRIPDLFSQDLFACLGERRPDYRWLIIGPPRSGSSWHKDPNGTSAWNAVVVGKKLWICFPPDVTPPGVIVSDDEAEVQSPLSIAVEWFLNYYQEAKEIYGVTSKNSETRGTMYEGICSAGEIFFVPSGWWHLVINLEPSIAITQNFVSQVELVEVLHFMKYRSDQLSGFKSIATKGAHKQEEAIFELFVRRLRSCEGMVEERALEEALQKVERMETSRTKRYNCNDSSVDDGCELRLSKRRRRADDPPMSDRSKGLGSIWDQLRRGKGQTNQRGLNEAEERPRGSSEPTSDGGFNQFSFGFEI